MKADKELIALREHATALRRQVRELTKELRNTKLDRDRLLKHIKNMERLRQLLQSLNIQAIVNGQSGQADVTAKINAVLAATEGEGI